MNAETHQLLALLRQENEVTLHYHGRYELVSATLQPFYWQATGAETVAANDDEALRRVAVLLKQFEEIVGRVEKKDWPALKEQTNEGGYAHKEVNGFMVSFRRRGDKYLVSSFHKEKDGFAVADPTDPDYAEMIATLTAAEIDLDMGESDFPRWHALAEGETLHAYEYGGCMSMRGGYFVRDADGKIVRSKGTRMS